MKITATTLMVLHLSALAYCEAPPSAGDRSIGICVTSDIIFVDIMKRARIFTSKIFGEIGVSIHWQSGGRSCPVEAIVVKISANASAALKPGALAYALPYEGRHIQVFYNRIESLCNGAMMDVLLAHVLAHEITHILEGIAQHSQQGLMKAKWDNKDYVRMRERSLKFTPEDVNLIYEGLLARQERAMLAINTAAASR
jgi:hypothetical protein